MGGLDTETSWEKDQEELKKWLGGTDRQIKSEHLKEGN